MYKNRWLYFLAMPGIIYFIMFRFVPMWGLTMAFQNFNSALGFLDSPWVGFQHFIDFFTHPNFYRVFRNTFLIALYNLVFFFPLPIILALMLNSVRLSAYKRTVQTITFLPNFLSWVVIASITHIMLTVEGGVINDLIVSLGGSEIPFLTSQSWFRPIILLQTVWRDTGWGTIIFLAALSNVDPELYDAAHVDGANAWQRMWNITLPSISTVIVTLLILRMGTFLDTGFTQIFLMINSLNRPVGEVIDTYVYHVALGPQGGRFSYATAVGLFKSVIGVVLVLVSDRLAKKAGGTGIL